MNLLYLNQYPQQAYAGEERRFILVLQSGSAMDVSLLYQLADQTIFQLARFHSLILQ